MAEIGPYGDGVIKASLVTDP